MATRQIVRIDEDKCNGCGQCIPSCAEGAIQLIDGKARLVAENLCDGLGACLGECPQGAISVEQREADAFDEDAVERHRAAAEAATDSPVAGPAGALGATHGCAAGAPVAAVGPGATQEHAVGAAAAGTGAHSCAAAAARSAAGAQELPMAPGHGEAGAGGGCPGSRALQFAPQPAGTATAASGPMPSALGHWPVQLHLVSPYAPAFQGADVLLAADCTAYAVGDFHRRFLAGKALAVACPKLDHEQERYVDKLVQMIDGARINTLTVVVMEVPCCTGLVHLARQAASRAQRRVPVKRVVISVQGDVCADEWL